MPTIDHTATVIQASPREWVVISAVGAGGISLGVRATLARAANLAAQAQAHLMWEECAERYPRLTRCVQNVLIGSASEAACCIRDYRDGERYGSEAVSWSGLSPADRIRQAVDPMTRRGIRMSAPHGVLYPWPRDGAAYTAMLDRRYPLADDRG